MEKLDMQLLALTSAKGTFYLSEKGSKAIALHKMYFSCVLASRTWLTQYLSAGLFRLCFSNICV